MVDVREYRIANRKNGPKPGAPRWKFVGFLWNNTVENVDMKGYEELFGSCGCQISGSRGQMFTLILGPFTLVISLLSDCFSHYLNSFVQHLSATRRCAKVINPGTPVLQASIWVICLNAPVINVFVTVGNNDVRLVTLVATVGNDYVRLVTLVATVENDYVRLVSLLATVGNDYVRLVSLLATVRHDDVSVNIHLVTVMNDFVTVISHLI